jgi:hypothetical protein
VNFALAVFFLFQSAAPFPQAPNNQTTATIEGFVVRAGTNEPISRARVTALRMTGPDGASLPPGPRQAIPAVTTDSQGYFVLRDLPPGSYSLTAGRNGFARQAYGERAPGRPGAPLNVVAGQSLKDLAFRLIPGGTITGRVADVTGEPLAGMNVQLVKAAYNNNGKRTFQTSFSARTDDRGEYRLYWITPGRYYLNVNPIPAGPTYQAANEVIDPGYVVTFYPGAIDPSMAEAIEVRPGAEMSGIDFTLAQQPLFRLRGRVFDTRTGQSPRNANVLISPRSPSAFYTLGRTPVNYDAASGTFEIRDVPAGSYWVRAFGFDPTTDLTPGGIARNSVQVPVEVNNADVENMVLALASGFQMQGRVVVDGAPLASLPDLERAFIYLEPFEPATFAVPQKQLKADGLFTLENIPAGDYRVMLGQLPAKTFIESIRLGQTDVSSGMTITAPLSDQLEVVLSTKSGLIEGTIVDRDQKAMPGVQAILVPDRQRERRDLYRFANTDQNGRFTLRTIAPGDYKIFAWEDAEPGAYNDPEFLRNYEAAATPAKVSESESLSVVVKVLAAN